MWLLPLGVFIKPSQEKTACDGQRPFHMCSMIAKVRTDALGSSSKVNLTNADGTGAGAKYSASDGNDLVLNVKTAGESITNRKFYEFLIHSSYPLILRSFEHVPKI